MSTATRYRTTLRMEAIILAAVFFLIFSSLALGQSIGVNFVGGRSISSPGWSLTATESAGVVPQQNWNNAADTVWGSGSTNFVRDDSGVQVTGMTVTWAFTNSYAEGYSGTDPDAKLMDGYLDDTTDGFQQITVTNIPFPEYDVYVYVGSDGAGRNGMARLNGSGTTYYFLTVGSFSNYIRATATTGAGAFTSNYARFDAISGSDLTIEVGRNGSNCGCHGFQIVARFTPVPRLVASPGKSLHFLGQGPITVDDAIAVSDQDSTHLQSATVRITNLLDAGREFLAATPSGAIAAGNISYSAPTLTITGNATLANYEAVLRSVTYNNVSGAPNLADRVIRFNVSDGTNTSNDADKAVAVGGLLGGGEVIINEIYFEPENKRERVEYIELYNNGSTVADVSGWFFSDGVSFTFPPNTYIAAGSYLVVGEHPGDIVSRFGVAAEGPWTGKLDNTGERIQLRNAAGVVKDEVDYQLGYPWPTMTAGKGSSMELIHPSLDNDLGGSWRASGYDTAAYLGSPTPGAVNTVFSNSAPPQTRQVKHTPHQPTSGQDVTITVKATDPQGVGAVTLEYQLVNPGNFIRLSDAAYNAGWTSVPMHDDGLNGDAVAGDDTYSVVLPGTLQTHRRLVRYRITATDNSAQSITVPYSDDLQPNFAYFVYDGAPGWSGSKRPGVEPVVNYSAALMNKLPVYCLLATHQDVVDAMYHPGTTRTSGYGGSDYLWEGALVYDGDVYDHIHFRARGGVWRYAMGKNMWKFKFNAGRRFQARDDYGKKYNTQWRRLNLSAIIQQGNYLHRGEQGMFESVGFRLFDLAGAEGSKTHFISLRVIDDAAEATASQYDGDLWGMYLVVEQLDGRFLDEHTMPDSNIFKMEGGGGVLKYQADYPAVGDSSDRIAFQSTYESGPQTEQWWRDNLDLWRYYGYRTILIGIHHYDVAWGKNYYYFNQIQPDLWSVHPWDLDLTWTVAYGNDGEPFRDRVLPIPAFNLEFRNRSREIRDLLYNTDQTHQLIDEMAAQVYTPGQPSWVDVDCAVWDYNPIMISSYVNSSKAGQGRFYESAVAPGGFPGMVQKMKNFVVDRSNFIDTTMANDPDIPNKPTVTALCAPDYPVNDLRFRASAFSDPQGGGTFGAMKWRIAEVTDPTNPNYDPAARKLYEINAAWESAETAPYASDVLVPAAGLKAGHTYRVRVRMRDNTGRWGHWSNPVQFIIGDPNNDVALTQYLRITEVMYQPAAGGVHEFVELHNTSTNTPLDLSGVQFSDGITFAFDTGVTLAPNAYLLVANSDPAGDFAAFRSHYGMETNSGSPGYVPIYGPYDGQLRNEGETLRLSAAGGTVHIVEFEYDNARGWPLAPQGGGHSLVPLDSALPAAATGSLYYGRNWRASTYINGSPGAADPAPPVTVVLNELKAHMDYSNPAHPAYDSNDWLELYNPTGTPISLDRWYLSDDVNVLQKWSIPSTATIAAGGRLDFDEVTGFHQPIALGFGLNKDGEQLLLSHFPAGGPGRVVDEVRFKGQEITSSLGRLPDGDPFWYPQSPTRAQPNAGNQLGVVLSEIMYHPDDDTTTSEYLELYNPASTPVGLWNSSGEWRIDGGVSYTFPPGTSVPGNGCLLIVPFDPADTAAMNTFLAAHGVAVIPCPVLGPYIGSLSNRVERVALERPQAPDSVGGDVSWVIADEAIYFEQAPFPPAADGTGPSLQRIEMDRAGNDPANWLALPGTPGLVSGVLAVGNLPATGITPGAATLNGTLLSDGGENPVVHIYWGSTDAGTNAAGWQNDVNLGTRSLGPFSSAISGLASGTTYYYRCFAQTSTGSVWATESASFVTGAVLYSLTVTAVNGVVVQNPYQSQYAEGAQVSLTPQPLAGFAFDSWSGDVFAGHEYDNPLILTMDGDKTISAHFVAVEPRAIVGQIWSIYP